MDIAPDQQEMRPADMFRTGFPALLLLVSLSVPVLAAENKIIEHNAMMDHGDGHLMDMDGGMVMGQNKDKLPGGCDRISEDAHITVHGGHKYSKKFPGTMFAFDTQEWRFKPCTRVTVTFVNEDNVRHQWMMHGLPKYMYDKGMFHLEVTGPAKVSGTFILPAEDRTYLVHCDIAQHMEKGMKGELVVGKGSGTFPSIPGLTDPAIPDSYETPPPVATAIDAPRQRAPEAVAEESFLSGSLILGLVAGLAGTPLAIRHFRGKPASQILAELWALVLKGYKLVAGLVAWLIRILQAGAGKFLPKK
jgi:plastocyanin